MINYQVCNYNTELNFSQKIIKPCCFQKGFVAQRFHNYMILKVLIIFDPELNLFKSYAYTFMQQSPFQLKVLFAWSPIILIHTACIYHLFYTYVVVLPRIKSWCSAFELASSSWPAYFSIQQMWFDASICTTYKRVFLIKVALKFKSGFKNFNRLLAFVKFLNSWKPYFMRFRQFKKLDKSILSKNFLIMSL